MGIAGTTSEKLSAEHIEMVTDKSKSGFLVKVGNRGSRMTSRRNSESAVLDALDQGDGGRTCVGNPNSRRIVDDRFDIGLICPQQHLLLTAPTRARQRAHDTEFIATRLDDF